MTVLSLYLVTFAIFLVIDFFGLSYLVKPVFEREIKSMLRDRFRFGPAFAFYAFYIAGLLWFVSWPALQNDQAITAVLGSAVLLGAMAYGTYEITNLATLKGWTWRMVAVDLTWGALLTGVSATLGVQIIRMLG